MDTQEMIDTAPDLISGIELTANGHPRLFGRRSVHITWV